MRVVNRKFVAQLANMLLYMIAISTVFITGCPITQPQDTPVHEIHLQVPETGTGYYLYVPSEYVPSRKWPLVVTLHGTHGFDNALAQVKEWKALAEENGFIVLAPELISPQGILPVIRSLRLHDLKKDEKRILSAIENVKQHYNIDDRNILITGFSAGGYPLYYVAVKHPQLFNCLVARACNFDSKILASLGITEELRKMPMLIFYGKTGINPISSLLNPLANQSWEAFRYFREHKCFNAKIKAIAGGHLRRPEIAYNFWRRYWPKSK